MRGITGGNPGSTSGNGAQLRLSLSRVCALLIVVCVSIQPLVAQEVEPLSDDQVAVLKVVDAIFDAMRASDGEALRALLTDDATLVSTSDRDGRSSIRTTPASSWVESVARSAPGRLNEIINNPIAFVDQHLAVVWAPYRFHLGDEFQHCGVNVLEMIRTETGWRVFQLADTRRQEGCDP